MLLNWKMANINIHIYFSKIWELRYKIRVQISSFFRASQVAPVVKEPACQCRRHKRCGFDPWVRKIPWRKKWHPTPVFLPGKSHWQRSLAGWSPWGCRGSDTTEQPGTQKTSPLPDQPPGCSVAVHPSPYGTGMGFGYMLFVHRSTEWVSIRMKEDGASVLRSRS